MEPKRAVDVADEKSRKRAGLVAAAAGVFAVAQVLARPFFAGVRDTAHAAKVDWWAINAALLLVLLATGGGGLMNSRQIRLLINDEVSQSHYRTAVISGYWVAMVAAMGLYVLEGFMKLTGRDVVYVVVSASIVVALFVFSYLEFRAHRDE